MHLKNAEPAHMFKKMSKTSLFDSASAPVLQTHDRGLALQQLSFRL